MNKDQYKLKDVHISLIGSGDTIEHEGKIMTVCKKDIRRGGVGLSVFGDSYHSGHKPVKKVIFLTPSIPLR